MTNMQLFRHSRISLVYPNSDHTKIAPKYPDPPPPQVKIIEGCGQRILQDYNPNISVDMIRVPKAHTLGK